MSGKAEPAGDRGAKGAATRATEQVAIILSYHSELHRKFCNACIKEAGVMKQYTGSLLGHCETIECIEGFWPKNQGLGVLLFECSKECQKWLYSDPVFRASDFLEQVEMYCVPLSVPLPQGYAVLSIMNLDVQFKEIFNGEYLKRHEDGVRSCQGIPCVASTDKVQKVKGMRNPKYFIVDAWKCRQDFDAWYKAESETDSCALRQQTASGEFILAELKRQI
uniref:DUF1330 domain-containing protein n=1 Tax=Macrostomum lignano TaxID=282301 RepID=A0A1I8GXZ2_9PLAT